VFRGSNGPVIVLIGGGRSVLKMTSVISVCMKVRDRYIVGGYPLKIYMSLPVEYGS